MTGKVAVYVKADGAKALGVSLAELSGVSGVRGVARMRHDQRWHEICRIRSSFQSCETRTTSIHGSSQNTQTSKHTLLFEIIWLTASTLLGKIGQHYHDISTHNDGARLQYSFH